MNPSPSIIVGVVCIAEILSMTPFSMFLALQPELQHEWRLSNTASGWISSAYFTGYMLAVPLLGSLTDRIDARAVWLGACALAGLGSLGFAMFAGNVWTAAVFQLAAGAGLAGTYMPGLKVITDRLDEIPRPRHVAFYTTSFTIGSSVSFWIIGHMDTLYSWRVAVALSSIGPFAGCLLVLLALRPRPLGAHAHVQPGAHLKSVLRSGDSVRYIVGYAAHVWELFAMRAWIVPFVVFCERYRGTASPLSAGTLAAVVSLVGVPASLTGAELTTTFARSRLIVRVMIASIAASLLVVPAAHVSWMLLIVAVCLYSAVISADSAALTSGIVAVAPPASRGTAMAIYSTLGFAAASVGTFAVGFMLDALGGQTAFSWGVAFAMMSAPNVIGALALSRSSESAMENGRWKMESRQ